MNIKRLLATLGIAFTVAATTAVSTLPVYAQSYISYEEQFRLFPPCTDPQYFSNWDMIRHYEEQTGKAVTTYKTIDGDTFDYAAFMAEYEAALKSPDNADIEGIEATTMTNVLNAGEKIDPSAFQIAIGFNTHVISDTATSGDSLTTYKSMFGAQIVANEPFEFIGSTYYPVPDDVAAGPIGMNNTKCVALSQDIFEPGIYRITCTGEMYIGEHTETYEIDTLLAAIPKPAPGQFETTDKIPQDDNNTEDKNSTENEDKDKDKDNKDSSYVIEIIPKTEDKDKTTDEIEVDKDDDIKKEDIIVIVIPESDKDNETDNTADDANKDNGVDNKGKDNNADDNNKDKDNTGDADDKERKDNSTDDKDNESGDSNNADKDSNSVDDNNSDKNKDNSDTDAEKDNETDKNNDVDKNKDNGSDNNASDDKDNGSDNNASDDGNSSDNDNGSDDNNNGVDQDKKDNGTEEAGGDNGNNDNGETTDNSKENDNSDDSSSDEGDDSDKGKDTTSDTKHPGIIIDPKDYDIEVETTDTEKIVKVTIHENAVPEGASNTAVLHLPIKETDDGLPRVARQIAAALVTGGIALALVFTGALNYLWMLLIFFLFKQKERWHGVLTNDQSTFIKVNAASEDTQTVEMEAMHCHDVSELYERIKDEGSYTEIPKGSKVDISYLETDGTFKTVTMDANELKVYEFLRDIRSDAVLSIYNGKAKFNFEIKLNFKA